MSELLLLRIFCPKCRAPEMNRTRVTESELSMRCPECEYAWRIACRECDPIVSTPARPAPVDSRDSRVVEYRDLEALLTVLVGGTYVSKSSVPFIAESIRERWLVLNPKSEALVERIAFAAFGGSPRAWELTTDGTRQSYRRKARAVLAALAGDPS